MGKRVLTPEEAAELGLPPNGPDAAIPEEPQREPQSIPETALHHFGKGASFGFTEEGRGLMAGAGELSQMLREGVGLEEKTSRRGMIERLLKAYRDERDDAKKDIREGVEDNPGTALGSELLGAVMTPAPKGAPLAKGATSLQRMGAMGKSAVPVGLAFGAGNSDADLTKGEVGEFLKDTATGGALSYGTGAVLGGALHGPMSKLEDKGREAVDKAAAMAQKAYDEPQASALGSMRSALQSGHRDLEKATQYAPDAEVDAATAQRLQDLLAGPQGLALKNRIAKGTADNLPGRLSEIDAKQAAFEAARAVNTPENVAAKQAEILGPERFKEATMMRLKKYAGRTVPPLLSSYIGKELGGAEGAFIGAGIGGLMSAVGGNPVTALANYMREPSVMLRLANAGQRTLQAPIAPAASLTSDEEQRRRYLELLSKGR